MNKVEKSMIKFAIDFERYKNGQANEILALLDKANAEIAKYVRQTKSVATKARYREVMKKIREISEALQQKVESGTDIDGIIDYELKKQEKILGLAKDYIKDIKGGRIDFLYPSLEQIKTAALFKPIDTKYGLTFQSYLEGISSGLYNTWDSALRTGYLTGQTTQQIVKNVIGEAGKLGQLSKAGAMHAFRNSVYANTRTALQSFANETMQRVYKDNEKYFGDGKSKYKYKYLATLDNRTCLVCAALDGKLYKSLEDVPSLPQHRGCVTGDTFVSTVGRISKVYKRRYKGLLYRITTSSGNTLTVTPNHPILTDKGFIRAHLLNVGDNVISDNGLETIGIVGKGKDDGKSLIKDVFCSFCKSPPVFTCTMPTTPEDFHGDAVYNKVDVISADRELGGKRNVSGFKLTGKDGFVNGNTATVLCYETHKGGFFQIFNSHSSSLGRLVSGFRKFGDLLWTGITHPLNLLFVWVPLGYAVLPEKSNHCGSTDTETAGNSRNSDSLVVKLKNFINRKIVGRALSACINSSFKKNEPDDVFGATELSSNILDRYSAQISTDSIISVDVKFSFTHVYNLETENNWYIANGIITHNCRCIIVPYFDIENDVRASKDGYVSSKVTFEDWLEEQDEKTQREVLGTTRFKMFKDGTKIKDFVDRGEILTLEELKKKGLL